MNINILSWHTERQLKFCPKHFVKAPTPVSEEAELWIMEKCKGRYYLSNRKLSFRLLGINLFEPYDATYAWFEDKDEAMFYELTWS